MRTLIRSLQGRCASESGQILAFAVGILIVLFGFVALAVDVGIWYYDHRFAQNEADAAALAAVGVLANNASQLDDPDVPQKIVDAALQYIAANDNEDPPVTFGESFCNASNSPPEYSDPDLPAGYSFPQGVGFADMNGDGDVDTVRVCIRRPSQVFFSSIFGLTSVTTGAVAAAHAGDLINPWADLPDPCTETDICSSDEDCDPDFDFDNPEPGTYCSVTFDEDLVLPPGTYVFQGDVSFDNADIDFGAGFFLFMGDVSSDDADLDFVDSDIAFMGDVSLEGGQLFSNNVFVFLTCNPTPCNGASAGTFSASLNAEVRLLGPEPVFWVDRSSVSSASCLAPEDANFVMTDNAALLVDSSIYARSGTVYLDGTGAKNISGSIVARSVALGAGNGDVTVTQDIVANEFCDGGADLVVGGDIIIGGGGGGLIE
ncbi:MAG TPA: pilus assembly protein TadG-related protein [Dehalococcoidia bacterium]|nr:pilus assembly protein TadG-related protein [Dehalococcoidia bacterium]